MVSLWRAGTAALALVAAIFHLWSASTMPLSSIIGQYFAVAGTLFLVGAVLILLKGSGIVFKAGTVGVLALAAIDNGLLYYTRTFGLGFLGRSAFPSPPPGVTFTRSFTGSFNGTFTRSFTGTFTRSFNGTFTRPSGGTGFVPPGGHFGLPWSTTWIPPGAVQFFVLQCAIVAVAAVALWQSHVQARALAQSEGGGAAGPSQTEGNPTTSP